jgi:serine/threonine protein kinase
MSHFPTDPEDYTLKAEIGKGAFATVYLAYCKPINVIYLFDLFSSLRKTIDGCRD